MGRRRFRSRLPLLLTLAALVVASAAYIFGIAWKQSLESSFLDMGDLITPRCIDVLVFVWLFWFGSSIGSFLNVVAWRMPRGISINGRSHCPRCQTHLKGRDNFPVLGWISLGGRCRTCRLPISARYPIVEASVGLSLSLVGVTEIYRMSMRIPGQVLHAHAGPLWTPTVDRLVITVLIYHTVVLATCWAFGLVRYDKTSLPWRLVLFGFFAAIVPMLVLPELMLVPWQTMRPPDWIPTGLRFDALMRVITALVAATVFGRSLARGLCPAADPKLNPLGQDTSRLMNLIAILAMPSILVGWQVLPAVIVLASLIAIALRKFVLKKTDMFGAFAIAVPIALTFQLKYWLSLHKSPYWPGDQTSHWVILCYAAIVLIIPAWLRDAPQAVLPVEPAEETQASKEVAIAESEPDKPAE